MLPDITVSKMHAQVPRSASELAGAELLPQPAALVAAWKRGREARAQAGLMKSCSRTEAQGTHGSSCWDRLPPGVTTVQPPTW